MSEYLPGSDQTYTDLLGRRRKAFIDASLANLFTQKCIRKLSALISKAFVKSQNDTLCSARSG